MNPIKDTLPRFSGQLTVTGAGAKKLLQGQLTCDLEQISLKPSPGAHCHRSGKIISLFTLAGEQDNYTLNMPRELVPLAMAALQKYAPLYRQVSLSDESFPAKDITDPLLAIKAGFPALYPETSGMFFAHELNLIALGAVSLDKGCYTGQEIIARMHYRGKPKTHLLRVSVTSAETPVRGSDIFKAEGPAGKIVDFAALGNEHYALLVTAPLSPLDTLFMDDRLTLPLKRE